MDEQALLRFLEGDCSLAESAAIQAWLAADPRRVELLDQLRLVWRGTGGSVRSWDVARARERLMQARGLTESSATRPLVLSRARTSWWIGWPAWRVVAGIVITITAGVTFLLKQGQSQRTYETGPGQRMELSLPDGSRVLLSAATWLRISRHYGESERAVELRGEGYFMVQHDEDRRFVVRTTHGVAEDLGTEFGVRDYPQDTTLRVVVASGRVALHSNRNGTEAISLGAHERGEVDALGKVMVQHEVVLENYLAWTQGRLVFDQAPLADVIETLERWYDLEIQTRDPALAEERVTISFSNQSADQAISELATVLNARPERADRRVQLIRH